MDLGTHQFLKCHTTLVMDNGTVEATEGKFYEVIRQSNDMITIKDDSNDDHTFDVNKESDQCYRKWFTRYSVHLDLSV